MLRKITLIVGCLIFSACSTAPRSPLLSLQDMDNYTMDCSKKAEQLDFLRRQLPSREFRYTNDIQMSGIFGQGLAALDGSYYDRMNQSQGWTPAVVRRRIKYLENYCP